MPPAAYQSNVSKEPPSRFSFSDKVIHAGPGEEPCKYRHLVPKLSRTIGHAFGPNDGRIHFNDMEDWNYKASPIYTDVYAVALHFIGHMLGLRHSQASDSVMWTRYTKFRQELSQDDIIKIRNLYGELRLKRNLCGEFETRTKPVW